MAALIAPYFGYAASLCLILALLVSNDLKFRWFNTLGNLFFIAYGIFLFAVPILITNLILLAINVLYLVKVYRRQEYFELIEFSGTEQMARKFLAHYAKDVASYFPDFKPDMLKENLNFVVLRDLVIANMFSARVLPDGTAEVILNYTLEKYRDYKVGTFIFERERDFLQSKGIKQLKYTTVSNKQHRSFLKRMGFVGLAGNGFVKPLL